MTEYDYSEDAYQAFKDKLRGVGKWAQQQAAYSSLYSSPFQPSSSESSSSLSTPTSPTQQVQNAGHHSHSRSKTPTMKRSFTDTQLPRSSHHRGYESDGGNLIGGSEATARRAVRQSQGQGLFFFLSIIKNVLNVVRPREKSPMVRR